MGLGTQPDNLSAVPTPGLIEDKEEEWSGVWYHLASGLVLTSMALVLLAAVSYQCAATWKWLRTLGMSEEEAQDGTTPDGVKQNSIRISHSLPDLQQEPTRHEYVQEKDNKKVLRQTTLPSVPTRHQTFQRQLSHRLDFENVQFSVCRLEPRNDFNVGLIKPELYSKEMLRQGSEDSDTVEMEYCGKLHFALKFDSEMDALFVKVLEARDLPIKDVTGSSDPYVKVCLQPISFTKQSVLQVLEARDLPIKDVTGSSDPYVKVYLLPDRKKKFQTKVHRKNLNPVFNETFIFSVTYEELRTRYLQFSVYDFDRFSRHDLIGQVVLKGLLDCTDLLQEIEYTMNILCAPQEKKALGELMLTLCYLPKAGRLTVTIIKGQNLKAMDITGSSDPYVKVYLVCNGKRIRKKRTSVKRSSLSPIYNEALTFDVPASNIDNVSLIIKVIDYDRIGSDELMGCLAIGSSFIGVGRDHWLKMLESPRDNVAQWYPLMESIPGVLETTSPLRPVSLSCLNGR